jgi:hypothetical protein
LNADTNLISKAGMLELMAEPLFAKWSRFIDLEISTIHSYQAKCSDISLVAILPLDLDEARELAMLEAREEIQQHRREKASQGARLTKSRSPSALIPIHTHFLKVFSVVSKVVARIS